MNLQFSKKTIAIGGLAAVCCIFLALWQWANLIELLRPIGRIAHINMPEHVEPPFGGLNFGKLSQPMTVLFMGTDVVYEAQRRGENVKADRVALNGRSDTMMVVFLNPEKMRVSVLNIPRDTEAFIGKYGIQKINSANALGGPDLARATITGLLNVPIDHYVVMNIQGLVQLVNELGGVTVEVPKKMSYMDWTAKLKIDLEPGVHTLTGNQSMGFVRYRHDELGDIGRVQRQQIFLQAAMRKMMDPRSWPHVPALVKIARQSINTDMTDMQIFECLNFVRTVPKSSFKFVMLPGQFAGNGDWVATTDARTLALHMASPDQDLVSSRRNLSVCVINTTSDPNMGGKVARALGKLGYIASVGKDQPDVPFNHTRIIAQYGNTADAEMLKADLGGTGEVVNASVGNLNTALTVFVRSDVDPEKVTLSSVDAPYVPPTGMPQPLVVNPHADRPSRPHLGDAPPPIDSTAVEEPAEVEQRVVDTAPGAAVDANGADTPVVDDSSRVKSGGEETRETREPSVEPAPTPGGAAVPNPTERLRRNENNGSDGGADKTDGTKGGAVPEGGAGGQ
ncbi:MAG: LCP family protein [Cyanobacteria bacterium SZAS LIN-2]|nr:LCP family protein [Cyanobacteria bacterium SZAS LIN-3]MBS1999617.1 LCP family protein [Cyanobacteria bacterium SZAS LIN-2]